MLAQMPPSFRSLAPLLLALLGAVHCADSNPPASTAASAGAAGLGGAAGQPGAGAGGAGQSGMGGSPSGMGGGGTSGLGGGSDALEVLPAMFVAENVDLDLIDEGEAIPLTLPPQGGHVLWVGAYIRNVHSDTIELGARLRDPDTNALVAEEKRTVVVRPVPGQPGLFQPDIRTVSQVAHIPVCPVYDPKPIVDTPYILEVSVRELYVEPQRTAKGSRTVTPTCSLSPEAQQPICRCECEANYTLGKCKDVSNP